MRRSKFLQRFSTHIVALFVGCAVTFGALQSSSETLTPASTDANSPQLVASVPVANEVRTLAEQSANATKEIEEIIEEIQAETNEVIKAMDIGRKRVLIGTKLVKGTRQALTDLAKVSTSINRTVEKIAQSASTQVNISNELNQTMQDVAKISNQTSEQSVKVAESFTKLLGVAGELQQSVSEFKVK